MRYGDERPVLPRGDPRRRVDQQETGADRGERLGVGRPARRWLAVSVSTLLIGAALVWLAPGALRAADRALRERLGPAIGWGVVVAIGRGCWRSWRS